MNIKNLFNQKKSKKQTPLSKHEKLKLKRLKTNANRAKKNSSQNTLKYTSLFENGLMNIVDDNYSMTYELGSTNYATATIETKQTIFEKYNSMINTISDEEHFQLTILVSKVHSKEYQQKNEFELQGDDYDYLREELNHLILENYQNGYNNYQIDRYITISTKAENKKKALSKLKNTETLLASSLAPIEVPIKQQTGLERLSLFNKILNYDKPLYGNFDDIKKSCLTTKDLIAPQSLKFSQSGVEVGERFNQVLYLKEFPMELSDGLFKDLSMCGQELVITIQADPYSIIETSKRLRMQATSIESEVIKQQKIAIKDGYSPDFIGRTAKETQEDLKDGDDPVGLKSSFLVSLFSSLFETVSEIQESIIDEVTIETYQKYEKPTLLEWYEVLETKTFNNEEALDLTQKIKMYITGSMDIFSKETNVDLNSRFIVYDISQLTTKFKPFGFMALEENIWQRVVKNNAKGITTWVYFDEIQVLLSGKSSEISREKFKDIWSRIRKYGGNPTGITQFIDTVLETPEGRSMFFNSEFLVLLKQKKFAIEIIKQHYNITEQQEQYLKTPKKGSGLIIAGNAIVPFENTIPSSTELYKIMQTD